MHRNSKSVIRVNNTVGDKIDAKAGVHQGSVLSPFLFVIILQALSRECRRTLPWEMLYADDLAIIAESLVESDTRDAAWKYALEGKGLRENLAKTKLMISDIIQVATFTSGKHPCRVCCKSVGSNSMFCYHYAHWMHKPYSRLTGRLVKVVNFKCRTCLNQTVANDDDKKVQPGNVEYEVVDQFH